MVALDAGDNSLLKSYRGKHATCKGIRASMNMYLRAGREGGREGGRRKEERKEDGEAATRQWLARVTAVVFLFIVMLAKAFR